MSEPELDLMLLELRAKAPSVPEGLRERVRALPEPPARRVLQVRPALVAAVGIAVALGLSAALIGGLTGSPHGKRVSQGAPIGKFKRAARLNVAEPAHGTLPANPFRPATSLSSDALAPGSRLQNYNAVLRLRVHDLSDATKSAVRTTRKLGGYLAAADYSTRGSTGDSTLQLRVPVAVRLGMVQSPVPPLTLLIFRNPLEQMRPTKIRPQGGSYIDLGISELPQKKVTQAHLARSPHH